MFAWAVGGPTVGSFADTVRQPGIHTQWMFFFAVADLEAAAAAVRARGGIVVGTMSTSAGDLVAPCDDPQGGAFALFQRTPAP